MVLIIHKIWTLGGWFYLGLITAVIGFILIKKKHRIYIYHLMLTSAAVIALISTLKVIWPRRNDFLSFFSSYDTKMEEDTLEQYQFANRLRHILPPNSNGCVYETWDIPFAYLRQELYPRRFITVPNDTKLPDCKYIISQFKPRSNLNKFLILNYKNNYIYKLNK